MKDNLVDEFVLMIHPLILGEGHLFFEKGTSFTNLKLTEQTNTQTGVVIASYSLAANKNAS